MANILIACEFSGTVRQAFEKLGHYALSCDLLPTEVEGNHYQGDIFDVIDEGWDLMIAHPPCTYLTNAGVRHLYDYVTSVNGKRAKISGEARWKEMYKAADFFNKLKNAPIQYICIENPVPHKYAREIIGNYDQLIQPWQFGHKEMKATCLWLKDLPLLKPTNIVGPPPRNKEERKHWAKCHRASPGPNRWKIRSKTYQGIADALADQYGRLII